MRMGLFLFVVGVIVTAAAFDDILPNEHPLGFLDTERPQAEMAEQTLFRKGCSTGKACRQKKGICMSSSETCSGRVYNKGCGTNCTCCIIEPERCKAKKTCKEANGFCVKGTGSCTGSIIPESCTGRDCICCVNDNNCPNGFYRVGTECFKWYQEFAAWDKARHICQRHGWELAEPENLTALAEFIYTNVSHYYFWIGGRGVGDSIKYPSGQSLEDAPWGLGYPGDMTTMGHCVILRSINTSYTSPLSINDCYTSNYFICEPACPKGFIRSGSGCFKLVSKSQNWEDSEKNCHAEGLQIAEPEDPRSITKMLRDRFVGGSAHIWIGARGGRINGAMFAWNSGDPVPIPHPISNTWHPNHPRSKTSSYCLELYTGYYSQGPMYERSCNNAIYSLCELICPLGFFNIGNKCYKAYSSSAASWSEARKICNQDHLTLAEPHDPTALADYLFTVTGNRNYWLGGRGDGNKFRWSSGGEPIPSNWAQWRPGNPGNKVGTDYCLRLIPEHRMTPLTSTSCSTPLYPLCQ